MKNPGLNARDYAQEYYPAIVYAIKLLLDEKRERKCKSKCESSQRNYDTDKKITLAEIDEIVGTAFNISGEAAKAIRLCYCKKSLGETEKEKPFRSQFNPCLFAELCKKIKYVVSKEDLDAILVLIDFARPVITFYDKSNWTIFHEKSKELVDEYSDILNKICKNFPNTSYWNIILRYIRNMRDEEEEILYLLATLPTIRSYKVNALKQKIGAMQSSLSIEEIELNEKRFGYLKDLEEDLQKLYDKKGARYKNACDWDVLRRDILGESNAKIKKKKTDGFMNLSMFDLYFFWCNREVFFKISYYPIRPEDIRVVFRYMTKLDGETQLEVLNAIVEEDKIHPMLMI